MIKESPVLSVCRQSVFNIPPLYLMNHWFGLLGIARTQFAADALTLVVFILLYRRMCRKMGQDHN